MKTAQWNAFQNALRCFVNQPIRVQSEVWEGGGEIGSGAALSNQDGNTVQHVRDVSIKMHKRLFQF